MVTVYLDGGEKAAVQLLEEGIPAYGTVTTDIPLFTTPGTHQVTVTVNEDKSITESSYADNRQELRLPSRKWIMTAILFLTLLFASSVSATYAGDRPLENVFHTDVTGGYVYTTGGDSVYSGTLAPGDTWTAEIPVTLPDDAAPLYSRLYLYWAWSKDGQKAAYPALTPVMEGGAALSNESFSRYTDTKGGFVSRNDFFSGMDAYNISGLTGGDNTVTLTVTNTHPPKNATFVIQGAGILSVYESETGTEGTVWVNEGCDMLYNSYGGVTPEMATGTIIFPPGEVGTEDISRATLHLVAPSAGYTSANTPPQKNAIRVNRPTENSLPEFFERILSMLFPPGYNGWEWTDGFSSDEVHQIGEDLRDISPYLRTEDNTVTVRDNGDYMLLTNGILWIERGGTDE